MATNKNLLILTEASESDSQLYLWASALSESLTSSIAQIGAGSPEIFIEHVFSPEALKKTEDSVSIFIILNSAFLSDNRLKNFITKLDKKAQLHLVIPEPIKLSEIPEDLDNRPVYTFYDIDHETGLSRQYSPFGNIEESKLFWDKVLDMAFDIKIEFEQPQHRVENAQAIYLAITDPEQFENRDALKSELVHRGYAVYPDHLLKGNPNKISEEISTYLSKSLASIHIIGNTYGETLPEVEISLTELQSRLSAKHLRLSAENGKLSSFQRVIWIQPGIRTIDEKQRRYVASLRAEEKNSDTEILQTPLEELKAVLREKLDYINSTGSKLSEKTSESVYIIYEPKDKEKVKEIGQFLENQKLQVLTIDFERMSETIVASHYKFLTQTSSVIICDFESNRQWINSKLKDLVKAPGFGRLKPFHAKAIYTKDMSRYSGFDNLLLNANEDIVKAMSPFVQKLNQN